MAKQEHKAAEFLEVNPFGFLPAMTVTPDGGSPEALPLHLFESGALLTYLSDRYGGGNESSPEDRAETAKWILFANASMGNTIFLEKFREKGLHNMFGAMDGRLKAQDFINRTGEFSVADVAVGGYLLYIPLFFPELDLSPWPHIRAYMDRLASRPAYQATLGARLASLPPPPTRGGDPRPTAEKEGTVANASAA